MAKVVSLNLSAEHGFSKAQVASLQLIEGIGAAGDAHAGRTVQHLSRIAKDPNVPNLRQVHLIASELFAELEQAGHIVRPGDVGENVTTSGIDLLALTRGTILSLGEAQLEITGLRNPCHQIDRFQSGLLSKVVGKNDQGMVIRRAGIMAIVTRGGQVSVSDEIIVVQAGSGEPLEIV